jgi:hypothetical protein
MVHTPQTCTGAGPACKLRRALYTNIVNTKHTKEGLPRALLQLTLPQGYHQQQKCQADRSASWLLLRRACISTLILAIYGARARPTPSLFVAHNSDWECSRTFVVICFLFLPEKKWYEGTLVEEF